MCTPCHHDNFFQEDQ